MNWKQLMILILSFILYLVVGALIFSALESSNEQKTQVDLRRYKERLLANLTCLTEDKLEDLIKQIVIAVDSGIDPYLNVSTDSNWDFSNAFFFSGTVVTTIGYGNIAPTTSGGRAFCIFYALIGIPLFGLLMAGIAEKLKKRFHRLEQKVDKRFAEHPKVRSLAYAIILFSTTVVFFMVIPAAIFSYIENWSFLEGFYYAFITLTTIGLGDFVVGGKSDANYNILYIWGTFCWIIIGLSMLALVIGFISDAFSSTAEKIHQTHDKMVQKRKGAVLASLEEEKKEDRKTGGGEGKDGNSEELKDLTEDNAAEA